MIVSYLNTFIQNHFKNDISKSIFMIIIQISCSKNILCHKMKEILQYIYDKGLNKHIFTLKKNFEKNCKAIQFDFILFHFFLICSESYLTHTLI